ncbi:hypothetical protein [Chitinophaga deserti]|uniref:hypothetical protein n=1 Tax=Chitinophaga deserti TaxID=2164099 RepID=UPI000D6C24F9|nr:hypothetical protein [Chitinophaga deserti]
MTANRIIDHIFHEEELRNVDQQALERLVEQYPYFAAARVLLAQKQFNNTPDFHTPVFKAAQLYTSTPQYLYQIATEGAPPEAAAPVPADSWQATEIAVQDAVNNQDQAIIDNVEAVADQTPALHSDTLEAEVDEEEETLLAELEAPAELPQPISRLSDNGISDEDQAILDELAAEDLATAEALTAAEPVAAVEPDEIVAVDYEAEADKAAFDAARNLAVPDDIVAVDYEAEEDKAAFDAARNLEVPDTIVAVDYEAEEDKAAFDAARNLEVPDDIVSVDYDALRPETPLAYEPEIEEEEIEVPTGMEPEGHGLAIPPAPEAHHEHEPAVYEAAHHDHEPAEYEPEVEEEEVEVPTGLAPEGPGIAIPPAAEATAESAENEPDAPIRIHPMDAPEQETELTFQPLYTDDYFAYKKLKEPNNAESMTDKAAAEMRSFTDWLRQLKDDFAGKATKDWYHQHLHKLYEDEDPEVTERVEAMAIQSITLNDDIVSETLAEIWVMQRQPLKAIAVYQKLSLLNPAKKAYFAQKIKELQ